MLIKNELVSSGVVAVLVSVLVWLHVPKDSVVNNKRVSATTLVLKSFIISFIVAYAAFYFFGDSGSDDVLDNIITGEPDF